MYLEHSNVDEDSVKKFIKRESSKNYLKKSCGVKANKISQKRNGQLVLGADSVII